MSTYRAGLAAYHGLPDLVTQHPTYARAQAGYAGARLVRTGEPRFYRRGIAGYRVAGSGLRGLLDLIFDIMHVLLIGAGLYLLWSALRGAP